MHELALMTALVERVCEAARTHSAARVTSIHVVYGAHSGVVPEALRFCCDLCTAGTLAEGATLTLEETPACWQCRGCGAAIKRDDDELYAACPHCQSRDIVLPAGREFFLKNIEIE